jgi:hypothetical protein
MALLTDKRSRVVTLASPVVPQATLVQPWATRPDVGAPAGHAGRPSLMTPAAVTGVMIDATGEWLPLLAEFTDERRMPWKKWDLPATFTESDSGPARDDIGLKLHTKGKHPQSVRAVLDGGLPRNVRLIGPGHESASISASHVPAQHYRQASDIAEALYDQHIDLVNDLYDSANVDGDVFWDGPAGGVAAWPLERVLESWKQAALRDEPRPAFIVKLAATLGTLMNEVCLAPRRQLTRERRYQPAGRVQEIDATCLRWLARQPGYTVAEKAGAKQQAMGIDRVEHADTLENRIVRELMVHANEACERYLSENAVDVGHQRVVSVREFKRQLDHLCRTSPLRTLTPLAGIPQPNYVLQRDPRYRPLWKAYVMLLKQNMQRNQAWRWRHRVWQEAVTLAVLAALGGIAPYGGAMRSSVLMRMEQDAGRFIDQRTHLGRWEIYRGLATADGIDPGWRVHVVEQHQFAAYRACTPFPDQLAQLCPDLAVIVYDGERPDKPAKRILAVWSMFDFDLDEDHLQQRCKEIDQGLRMIRSNSELQGVIIQPKLRTVESPAVMSEATALRCAGYRLALPLQSQLGVFDKLLRQAVEVA